MKERKRKVFAVSIWVCSLAILAAACGGDGGDEKSPGCVVESLTAGTYSFEVSKPVEDGCAGGAVGELIGDGPYEFELPSYADLEAGPVDVVAELPGIGIVAVRFELEGEEIRISLPGGAGIVPIPFLPACSAVVTAQGVLCPLSETKANATLVLTLEDLVGTCGPLAPDTPCDVTVQLEGDRQAE